MALAGDLAHLRHRLANIDPDDDGRANVGERIATQVRPRGQGAVTVVGAAECTVEYDADAENP